MGSSGRKGPPKKPKKRDPIYPEIALGPNQFLSFPIISPAGDIGLDFPVGAGAVVQPEITFVADYLSVVRQPTFVVIIAVQVDHTPAKTKRHRAIQVIMDKPNYERIQLSMESLRPAIESEERFTLQQDELEQVELIGSVRAGMCFALVGKTGGGATVDFFAANPHDLHLVAKMGKSKKNAFAESTEIDILKGEGVRIDIPLRILTFSGALRELLPAAGPPAG